MINAIQEALAPVGQTSDYNRADGFGYVTPTRECGPTGREPSMEFQIRNKTFISSMVGIAAAVAVAGSANTAVAGVSLWDFRDFTIGTAPTSNNGGNTGVAAGNPFPLWQTSLEKLGTSMTGSGGKVNVVLSTDNSSSASFYLTSSTPVNLTGTTSFDSNVTSTNGVAAQWGVNVWDGNGLGAYMNFAEVTGNTVGLLSFSTSSNWHTDAGFGWSQVIGVDLRFFRFGTGATAPSFSFDSFTAVGAVPAPGALALLGAAGLVGARRRRA